MEMATSTRWSTSLASLSLSHIGVVNDRPSLPRRLLPCLPRFAAFITGMVTTSGHDPISEEEIKATFDYIDTNSNGMLDFDEFEYFFYVRGGGKDEATETKQPAAAATTAAGPTSDDVASSSAAAPSSSAASAPTGTFEPLPSDYMEWTAPRGAPKDRALLPLPAAGPIH